MSRTLILLSILFASLPVAAADLSGKPRIIDGDSFELSNRVLRLFGVDAPEADQTCRFAGKLWRCGMEATYAFAFETAEHWITCAEQGRDSEGRILALCRMGPHDLGQIMVRKGWALADRSVSDMYVAAETEAQRAGAGLWRGEFETPWAWRQRAGR